MIQNKKWNPIEVPNAATGTVIQFIDLDGRLRTKDEAGNVGYATDSSITVTGQYRYIILDTNVGQDIETAGNKREWHDAEGRNQDIYADGDWQMNFRGQP